MTQRLLSFLLTLLLTACQPTAKEKPALPAATDVIPVTLHTIQPSSGSSTIETTGLLATEDESKLSFKIGGVIESVRVDEGDFVKAGEVLATLRSTEIASQVNQVEINVAKAQRDYQRAQNLYRDSVATLEQLENAKTGLDFARQGLSAAQFNQQYARIYAPSDGFVVKRQLNTGEIAGPGVPMFILNHVSANSRWILKCGVTDAEWARIAIGDQATIYLDAYNTQPLTATVSHRSLTADNSNGAFSIELRVQLNGLKPAVGMYGKAQITIRNAGTALLIPYAALLEADGNKGYVFVPTNKNKVVRVPVLLGAMHQNQIEVLGGLENVAAVVVAGNAYLNEQSTITTLPLKK